MAYWEGRRVAREVLTMREILFRGKRIDNGEWAVGYLGVFKDGTQIYVPFTEEEERKYRGHIFSAIGGLWYAVDPSTVGQYTGLTDKNGKRIFEGDIVEGVDYDADDGFGVVCWNDGAFEVGNGSWCGTFHDNYFGRDFEIIGNIHDNPELMGGAAE